MINLNNKKFRALSNSENGELPSGFTFLYKQKDNILTCIYKGGSIIEGQLMGLVQEDNTVNLAYQQINTKGELRTGICHSKLALSSHGKIRIVENWQWTTGDRSSGTSILEEI